MDKERLLKYINDHFSISGEASRLILNIIWFVACQSDEEQPRLLWSLMDGTIGIERDELIREPNLKWED